jgi:hypothetical protein
VGLRVLIYKYTSIPRERMAESTTVKVSRENARRLAALQRSLHTRTMDETIEILVKRRRKELLEAAFGSDRSKSRKFTEGDRLENSG